MRLLPPPRKQGNHGREDDAAEQQGVDAWAAKGRGEEKGRDVEDHEEGDVDEEASDVDPAPRRGKILATGIGCELVTRRLHHKSTLKARASSTMKGVVSTKSVTSLFPR